MGKGAFDVVGAGASGGLVQEKLRLALDTLPENPSWLDEASQWKDKSPELYKKVEALNLKEKYKQLYDSCKDMGKEDAGASALLALDTLVAEGEIEPEKEKDKPEDKKQPEAQDKAPAEKTEDAQEKAEGGGDNSAEDAAKREEAMKKYEACVDAVHGWAQTTKSLQELSLEANSDWKTKRDDFEKQLEPLEAIASPDGMKALLGSIIKVKDDLIVEAGKVDLPMPEEG